MLRALHAVVILAALLVGVSTARAAVPGQFIAKMYTEALGRGPDPSGWQNRVDSFTSSGCSQAKLKEHGHAFYTSAEYEGLGYDNTEKLLTLYRGVLNREPDANGFTYWLNLLNQGNAFSTLVDVFFDSSEFSSLVNRICAGTHPEGYGWSAQPVLTLPTNGSGFTGGTGAQLQSLLNAATPGSTVYLAPRAVVRASEEIVVPSGVTLATTGLPDRSRYARMGRVVRTALFAKALIRLEPGAKLRSVWVTGQRPVVGVSVEAANIFLRSGTGGLVQNCRSDGAAGWSALVLHGSANTGIACNGVTVSGLLTTSYSSPHSNADNVNNATGGWSDGISNACEDATITNNHIVDPTDVGIVLFRASPAQKSRVYENMIVAAGVSAYGAIAVDPLYEVASASFVGMSIENNQFWSSPTTHFDIGIPVGTMGWFFDTGTATVGNGGSVRGNTTAGIRTRMDAGITIDGMTNVTVQANTLVRDAVETSNCPTGDVLAHTNGGHTSGSIQAYSEAVAHSCIGH